MGCTYKYKNKTYTYTQLEDVLSIEYGIKKSVVSNLSEEQAKIVRTEAFKNWFGDWENDPQNASKAVDGQGEPLVVYHGTADVINMFDERYGGDNTANNDYGAFYFSDDYDVAEDYGRQAIIRRYEGRNESELRDFHDNLTEEDIKNIIDDVHDFAENNLKVVSSFMNLRNPYVDGTQKGKQLDLQKGQRVIGFVKKGIDENYEFQNEEYYFNQDDINNYKEEIENRAREDNGLDEDDEIQEWQLNDATQYVLEENGIYPEQEEHDGVIIKDVIDDIGDASNKIQTLYIAIDSNQIKLADGSNKTFSPYDNDIRYDAKQEESNNLNFQIIGQQGAKNLADAAYLLNNLSVAKEMQTKGETPLKIKLATGWELNNKKWVYEIDDNLTINNLEVGVETKPTLQFIDKEFVGGNLSEVIDYPTLFEAYPEFKNIQVAYYESANKEVDDVNMFITNQNKIYINANRIRTSGEEMDTERIKQSLLHEITHKVQEIEQFEMGFSQDKIGEVVEELRDFLRNKNAKRDELTELGKLVYDWSNKVSPAVDILRDDKLYGKEYIEYLVYKHLASEVQARAVEKKYGMGISNTKLISNFEDIAEKNKIYIQNKISPSALLSSEVYNPRPNETQQEYISRMKEEIEANLLGDNAKSYFEKIAKDNGLTAEQTKSFLQKLQDWITQFSQWLANQLGFNNITAEQARNLSTKDILDRVTTSMLRGDMRAEEAQQLSEIQSSLAQKESELSKKNKTLKSFQEELVKEQKQSGIFAETVQTGMFGVDVESVKNRIAGLKLEINKLESDIASLKNQKAVYEGKDNRQITMFNVGGQAVATKPIVDEVEVVNGFYSPLEKIIIETKFDKLPAKQWVDKFAKGEEAKWTGLADWLSQQQGSVSKADIQQFLKDNRIQVVEVVKGGEQKVHFNIKAEKGKSVVYKNGVKEKEFDTYDKADDYVTNYKESEVDATKFTQYQLEGEKENYKEVLVTLPVVSESAKNVSERYWEAAKARDEYKKQNAPRKQGEDIVAYIDRANAELKNDAKYQELTKNAEVLNKKMDDANKNQGVNFKSSHFDEPNILVHLRMNTRTDTEGNKVLFLEELQSDFGQAGKKQGFKLTEKEAGEAWNIADKKYADFMKRMESKYGSEWESEMEKSEVEEETKLLDARENTKGGTIPQAPFVTDTNAWTKLALKVALKEAVKQGADKIAWSTGTQQFERWGSEEIHWKKREQPNTKWFINKNDAHPRPYEVHYKDKMGTDMVERYSTYEQAQKGLSEYENRWVISVNEQKDGATAFAGNEEALRNSRLSEADLVITNKEELRNAIKRNLARERNDAEIDKLTNRVWDRMQKEESGTSLPRKEGMKGFYGSPNVKISGSEVYRLSEKNKSENNEALEDYKKQITSNEYSVIKLPISELIKGDEDLAQFIKDEKVQKGRSVGSPIIIGEKVNDMSPNVKDGVIDGWHRISQALVNGETEIEAYVPTNSKFYKEGSLGIVGNVAKSLFKQEPKTTNIPISTKYNKIENTVPYFLDWAKSKGIKHDMALESWDNQSQIYKDFQKFLETDLGKLSTQHSIDITPEMVAEVGKGLPLFQAKRIESLRENKPSHEIKHNDIHIGQYTNIQTLKANPNYKEAKKGNVESAFKLLESININKYDYLKGKKDIEIVSVDSMEAEGVNVIPMVFARKLSDNFDLPINNSIFVANKPNHTGKSAMYRLLNPVEYQGQVIEGKKYFIVDDVSTTGSTLNDLKNYIEENGGIVVGAEVLAASKGGNNIVTSELDRTQLKNKHKQLDSYLKKYGINKHGVNGLSKEQTRYLFKFTDDYSIRTRVNQEEEARGERIWENKIENRYERQTPEGLPYVSDTASSYGASDSNILPDRSEGKEEFTTVRGMWRETKDIQFNGKVKIESPDDVAEIFALLENKSIEHSFAIYIDEKGYPTIQFLSVGARTQTVIDPIQVIAGVNKYKPKKVYLIHNHPSGSLKPSEADLNVTNAVRSSIGGVELEYIIINTYKKQYVLIDKDNYTSVRDRKGKEGDYYEIPIVSYNDVEFLEEPATQIKNSKSVIDFIQGQRFSALPKKGMLLLNRQNEVIANYLIKENDEKEGDSILDVIAKTPTTDGIILYGNTLNVPRTKTIKSILQRVGIGLLDSVVLNSDGIGVNGYYTSMMDEGLVNEHQQKYGTNSISKPEIISQEDIDNLPDCI